MRPRLSHYYAMDTNIITALITGVTAVLVNIISNIILSSRQTALLEYRLEQLEQSLSEIKELPQRVTVLETQVRQIQEDMRRSM